MRAIFKITTDKKPKLELHHTKRWNSRSNLLLFSNLFVYVQFCMYDFDGIVLLFPSRFSSSYSWNLSGHVMSSPTYFFFQRPRCSYWWFYRCSRTHSRCWSFKSMHGNNVVVNNCFVAENEIMDMLWFKFSFGAKFFKLVQFSFSFVRYLLP